MDAARGLIECPICTDEINNPLTTVCKHTFCAACITAWVKRQPIATCPACRKDVTYLREMAESAARKAEEIAHPVINADIEPVPPMPSVKLLEDVFALLLKLDSANQRFKIQLTDDEILERIVRQCAALHTEQQALLVGNPNDFSTKQLLEMWYKAVDCQVRSEPLWKRAADMKDPKNILVAISKLFRLEMCVERIINRSNNLILFIEHQVIEHQVQDQSLDSLVKPNALAPDVITKYIDDSEVIVFRSELAWNPACSFKISSNISFDSPSDTFIKIEKALVRLIDTLEGEIAFMCSFSVLDRVPEEKLSFISQLSDGLEERLLAERSCAGVYYYTVADRLVILVNNLRASIKDLQEMQKGPFQLCRETMQAFTRYITAYADGNNDSRLAVEAREALLKLISEDFDAPQYQQKLYRAISTILAKLAPDGV